MAVSGIELDQLDPAVRAPDDLYRHVNGRWLTTTEIPADKARWGSFNVLAEEAEKAVREIVESTTDAAPGSDEQKYADLYASFMAADRVNALGAAPLGGDLAAIAAIESMTGLLETIGRLERAGVGGFYQTFVEGDPGQPGTYVAFLEQGGLGLPDEEYYRAESFAEIRTAYLAHLGRMLALAGLDDAAARAKRVFDLETAIASHHWDKVRNRDMVATYNSFSWSELTALAPALDLETWRAALGAPEAAFAQVVVRQPSFSEGIQSLFVDEQLPAWKDWLAWQLVHARAGYLSDEFVGENFDFYGKTLSGTPELRERWKRGVSLVEGALGEAVGRDYVTRHYPPAAKAQMDELVGRLIEAYRLSIEALDWMGPETRAKALDKLAKFTPMIGHPVKWRDYSALRIDPEDLLGNVAAVTLFEFNRQLGRVGRPVDKEEWEMTPQTVNAYYHPFYNVIVFPAAILQPPFFDPNRDAAANYGAIGAVIGHEIGHGFDDQGSQFDGDGKLENWWTDADREAFEVRTRALIAQYDALVPAQLVGTEYHVNGAMTIGENIGDLGGLGIAWQAYLLSLGGEEPPVIDGLTGAQRFFLSWAQAWREKRRDAEQIRLLTIDPHSPTEFRCNQIVRNIDAYYDAFEVAESDALFLPAPDRVTIW